MLQDLSTGKVKGIGREADELYYLSVDKAKLQNKEDMKNQTVLMTKGSTTNFKADAMHLLWHKRLGHPSTKVLQHMFIGAKFSNNVCFDCSVYPLAKQTRLSFQLSTSRTSCMFELIHLDVWGPYKVATHNDFQYFLTIVDDFFRMCWLFLLRMKSDVVSFLKSFIVLLKNQFSRDIRRVRTDNGGEFFNNECCELLESFGIIHESSCPYTPQQNGVIERKYRHHP